MVVWITTTPKMFIRAFISAHSFDPWINKGKDCYGQQLVGECATAHGVDSVTRNGMVATPRIKSVLKVNTMKALLEVTGYQHCTDLSTRLLRWTANTSLHQSGLHHNSVGRGINYGSSVNWQNSWMEIATWRAMNICYTFMFKDNKLHFHSIGQLTESITKPFQHWNHPKKPSVVIGWN